MKTEYSTASSTAAAFENTTVTSQRELSSSIKEDDEAPATEPAEADAYCTSSSSATSSPELQQPNEVSSSSTTARVAEQSSPMLPPINDATSVYRPKKKQKMTMDDNNIKYIKYINDTDNSLHVGGNDKMHVYVEDHIEAENTKKNNDHNNECDGVALAPLASSLVDIGIGIAIDIDADEDDGAISFDSSDDEAIIKCMKLATEKKQISNTTSIDEHEHEDKDDHDVIASIKYAEQVAHIVGIFLDPPDNADDSDSDASAGANIDIDDCRITACPVGSNKNDDDGDDDASVGSSDDEAVIERMKLVATKKNTKKSKPKSTGIATATATAQSVDDESNDSSYCDSGSSRSSNNNNDTARRINNNKHDTRWTRMYQRLVGYKKEHNDTRVPSRYEKDPQLGDWVRTQRKAYREKSITEERKRLLNFIGFVWDGKAQHNNANWMEMYQRLVAYKKEHKDTRVPQKHKDYPKLGSWVNTQRIAFREKMITEERKSLLNSIGFVWDGKAWEEMYERLVAYKKKHNDTKVPQNYKGNRQLGIWVKHQRTALREKSITEERKNVLNSIGFVWDGKAPGTSTATWKEMYQRLVAYKKEHKDTRVPINYENDRKLGRWINNQRATYRKKKMTEERKRLLDSIGFVWKFWDNV